MIRYDDLSDDHATVSRRVLDPRDLDRRDDFRLPICSPQLATSNYATLMILLRRSRLRRVSRLLILRNGISYTSDAFIYLRSDGYGFISATEFTEHKQ